MKALSREDRKFWAGATLGAAFGVAAWTLLLVAIGMLG
jgi:hypothetical protein